MMHDERKLSPTLDARPEHQHGATSYMPPASQDVFAPTSGEIITLSIDAGDEAYASRQLVDIIANTLRVELRAGRVIITAGPAKLDIPRAVFQRLKTLADTP